MSGAYIRMCLIAVERETIHWSEWKCGDHSDGHAMHMMGYAEFIF